jgi:hypothetical protein
MQKIPNMVVCDEPNYEVFIMREDGTSEQFHVGDKYEWKRISAVCHARQLARRLPSARIEVRLAYGQ